MKKQEICAVVFFILFISSALIIESNCIISILCVIGMCIAVKVGHLSRFENDNK